MVPGYEVITELGRGGMGVAYLARHGTLQRLVALKMLLAGLHADTTARQRFRTEALALARLQHPNMVQIHEVGEHDGKPFLALEYAPGGSLMAKVAGTPQPERDAARLVRTLARAVHYMHGQGILHRDLKPTNILLTAFGTPKISDFGLAKLLDAESGPTQSEALIGTPNYMAPEQAAANAREVGPSTDVYSLGAILYELISGRAPFQAATPLGTLDQVRTQEPLPLRRLCFSVSPDLETICLKCLEKEPGKRYPSAGALADDLTCFLEGRPIQAQPVPVWQRLWRRGRRRPAAIAWTLVAVALVGILTSAWFLFRAADQMAGQRAEQKYQDFVQCRNEALVYGSLAPDEGTLFLRADARANLQTAESAAQKALALAGLKLGSNTTPAPTGFPNSRKAEVTRDSYALILILASIKAQQPSPANGGKGRYREALRVLDRAGQFEFETQAYHLRRAFFLERLGEQAEARRDRNRASLLLPVGALDHFLIGEEQYRRGDWEEAKSAFNRALCVQPAHFWAQFFLAVCHLKGRQWQAAKAGLNACLILQPDFIWAYLFRSFANEKLEARAEAETDFQKALDLNPSGNAQYVLLLSRGIHHSHERELQRAAADFRSARDLKPEHYHAYLNLAQVYMAQGCLREAAEQARAALRLEAPAQALAGYQFECGRSFLRDNRPEQAVEACEAALKLTPHSAPPHEIRGRALLALGRYEEAEKAFGQYLERGGERTSDCFRGRGRARMRCGKYPEAVEDYTRALELAPDGEVYLHRGWAHFFSDAWKLALRDFSAAIELEPEVGDAYTGRGLARVMLGDYREAVRDADVALSRTPSTPEMMHNIACIFAQAVVRAEGDRQALDRQSLARSYRRRALDAVHQTLALVPPKERFAFWRDKIQRDAALAPIRNDAGFQQIPHAYRPR
jgi:serine/threonine-protein kinase